jgi:hypothetical protein
MGELANDDRHDQDCQGDDGDHGADDDRNGRQSPAHAKPLQPAGDGIEQIGEHHAGNERQQHLVQHDDHHSQWRKDQSCGSIVACSGLFASSKMQPWHVPAQKEALIMASPDRVQDAMTPSVNYIDCDALTWLAAPVIFDSWSSSASWSIYACLHWRCAQLLLLAWAR